MGLKEDLSEKVLSSLSLEDETELSKLNGPTGKQDGTREEERRGRRNNTAKIPEAEAKGPNLGKGRQLESQLGRLDQEQLFSHVEERHLTMIT